MGGHCVLAVAAFSVNAATANEIKKDCLHRTVREQVQGLVGTKLVLHCQRINTSLYLDNVGNINFSHYFMILFDCLVYL